LLGDHYPTDLVETHRSMASWRYALPYNFYDGDPRPVQNPERFFEAVRAVW
jgi:hypothetical protein